MGHDHHHDHGNANAYYTEQLFNIAVCGAIGAVMILMYFNGMVRFLFGDSNPEQHLRVLLGGAGLLAIVLVRAVYVWFSVGKQEAVGHVHDHDHDHGDCDHEHGDCGHDHDHGHHHEHHEGIQPAASLAVATLPVVSAPMAHTHEHGHDHHHPHDHGHDHDHDHGWAPWRLVLLLLPVVLFLLGLPKEGFSSARAVSLSNEDQQALASLGGTKKGEAMPMTFKQLELASQKVDVREALEGTKVNLTGLYVGDDPTRFTLVRYKINCCAADALPLNAIIMMNPADQAKFKLEPAQYQRKWVSVKGYVHFLRRSNNEYLTAVFVHPSEEPLSELVKVVPAEANPWAN